ncbi:MAG: hypothetical protein L0H46_12665 [Brevibacterium sp.]|nr:hypothetical protein [Brevibacterium sp.]MDN5877522.1 hypothetical protein [Brevibacterium sp.]MDN6158748.1 hypothetical protein [Brevibacterium sp.]
MRFRTHKLSTTLVYAVTLALFMLFIFFLTNAGIDPRAGRIGDFDPKGAATACFGLLGLYHSIAIIFFNDDDSPKKTDAATDAHIPRAPHSYTGFVRQAWYKVLSVGPIFAVFCTASVFIWHSFAEYPGIPGTVWGDYPLSPLPALSLFLLCWAATNIGLTFASIAEAFNRDRTGLFIAAMIVMFIVGLGITVGFILLPNQPTGSALTVAVIAVPLSLIAVVGARAWAIARVAHYDANHPRLSARERRRSARFGHHPQPRPRLEGPPHDMLRHGEKLLFHFYGHRSAEPQMLIATDQRFVRASVLGSGRTFVLDQASPEQLAGASSQRVGHDLMTIAHLRDRQDMRVIGGDPEQSRTFAEAVTFLARTGQVRR